MCSFCQGALAVNSGRKPKEKKFPALVLVPLGESGAGAFFVQLLAGTLRAAVGQWRRWRSGPGPSPLSAPGDGAGQQPARTVSGIQKAMSDSEPSARALTR